VTDHGPARRNIDRHARDGVDRSQCIGACLDAAARILANVGLIR